MDSLTKKFKKSIIKKSFSLPNKSNPTIDFFLQGIRIGLDHTNNMVLFPEITYSYENQNIGGFNMCYCNVNLDYTNNVMSVTKLSKN